jgi:hypothetical protein
MLIDQKHIDVIDECIAAGEDSFIPETESIRQRIMNVSTEGYYE